MTIIRRDAANIKRLVVWFFLWILILYNHNKIFFLWHGQDANTRKEARILDTSNTCWSLLVFVDFNGNPREKCGCQGSCPFGWEQPLRWTLCLMEDELVVKARVVPEPSFEVPHCWSWWLLCVLLCQSMEILMQFGSWQLSLIGLKLLAGLQLVNQVTLKCYHLEVQSTSGQPIDVNNSTAVECKCSCKNAIQEHQKAVLEWKTMENFVTKFSFKGASLRLNGNWHDELIQHWSIAADWWGIAVKQKSGLWIIIMDFSMETVCLKTWH